MSKPDILEASETQGSEPDSGTPQTALGPTSWEDPEHPRLPAFFQTLREILRSPAGFFARPARGGPATPFIFGLIAGTAGSLIALFWWNILQWPWPRRPNTAGVRSWR